MRIFSCFKIAKIEREFYIKPIFSAIFVLYAVFWWKNEENDEIPTF